jgi:hypothetical protein
METKENTKLFDDLYCKSTTLGFIQVDLVVWVQLYVDTLTDLKKIINPLLSSLKILINQRSIFSWFDPFTVSRISC